jgi:hypothetical protein
MSLSLPVSCTLFDVLYKKCFCSIGRMLESSPSSAFQHFRELGLERENDRSLSLPQCCKTIHHNCNVKSLVTLQCDVRPQYSLHRSYHHPFILPAEPLVWCTTGAVSDEQHHMLILSLAPWSSSTHHCFSINLLPRPSQFSFLLSPASYVAHSKLKVLKYFPLSNHIHKTSARWVNAPATNALAALAVRAALAAT